MEDDLKKIKWKTTLKKKGKKGRWPHFFFEKLEWRPRKNERWPQKKIKNGRRPKKNGKKGRRPQKAKNGRRPKKKWKTNQSTKINLIGCDTVVNSPSILFEISKLSGVS